MKTLESFNFSARGGANYDWPTILNGRIHELKHGEDFHTKVGSFEMAIRTAAKALKRSVKISRVKVGDVAEANAVVVQAGADGSHVERTRKLAKKKPAAK